MSNFWRHLVSRHIKRQWNQKFSSGNNMKNDGQTSSPSTAEHFKTIAVLDLETCNLPFNNNNKTAITELCIYGFSAQLLYASKDVFGAKKVVEEEEQEKKQNMPAAQNQAASLPPTPRVLHKLTLLLNPYMMIHPGAEQITGLNNYMLEHETKFDENAADTVLGFLQHLQRPVCLVAHNGWNFDFPIVKQTFEKLKKELPSDIVCVDSLRAFLEIDKERRAFASVTSTPNAESPQESPQDSSPTSVTADTLTSLEDALCDNATVDWRQRNESTPKRAPITAAAASVKRKHLAMANDTQLVVVVADDDGNNDDDNEVQLIKRPQLLTPPAKVLKSRRSLCFGIDASPLRKKYPPRGVYRLQPMYERIFRQPATNAHHAEADVEMLMKLLLHYGEDFIDYAQQHAKPFADVPRLGAYK